MTDVVIMGDIQGAKAPSLTMIAMSRLIVAIRAQEVQFRD